MKSINGRIAYDDSSIAFKIESYNHVHITEWNDYFINEQSKKELYTYILTRDVIQHSYYRQLEPYKDLNFIYPDCRIAKAISVPINVYLNEIKDSPEDKIWDDLENLKITYYESRKILTKVQFSELDNKRAKTFIKQYYEGIFHKEVFDSIYHPVWTIQQMPVLSLGYFAILLNEMERKYPEIKVLNEI